MLRTSTRLPSRTTIRCGILIIKSNTKHIAATIQATITRFALLLTFWCIPYRFFFAVGKNKHDTQQGA